MREVEICGQNKRNEQITPQNLIKRREFSPRIPIVPQLSILRQFGGIKLIKVFEFEQTNKQYPFVHCCSQNGSS